MVNYIITSKEVIPMSSASSNPDHYVSMEDFNLLVDNKQIREEFLNSLHKDKIIIAVGGYEQTSDGVFKKDDSKLVKVGEVKW